MTHNDILMELDSSLESETNNNVKEDYTKTKVQAISEIDALYENFDFKNTTNLNFSYNTIVTKVKEKSKILSSFLFITKYLVTCSFIFGVLLLWTNYSAYYNIAKSYILKEESLEKTQSILNSVEAANIKKIVQEEVIEEKVEEAVSKKTSSIKKYKKELEKQSLTMDIQITPYENRVVIPKIGKNVPLLDIKNRVLEKETELDNIFMKELENGVVRYPGSAVPGEVGNTFIFGHSSNFLWSEWDYNDVFARLNQVEEGDEIIVYYNQKTYKYKITEKKVIHPGDVSVLKRDKNKKEISIMTCWPIGTTLNRLIVIGELIED